MNWLVTAALFAAMVIALLMRRIGRDADGRVDTRYFQYVGWVFVGGLVALTCGMLAGFPPRHPFILLAGMSSSYLSVYFLVLFASAFPLNAPAPLALRAGMGAFTALLVGAMMHSGVIDAAGPFVMSASMVPYLGLTLYFLRRNWKAATAPGARSPSAPVTIVQAAVLVPWIVSLFAYTVLAAEMPRPLPTWLYLVQALAMAMAVVGGVAVAILRYHLFEIRVLLGEAVIAVIAAGTFAIYVGIVAEPLHGFLAAALSPGFAALIVAGMPAILGHTALGATDRWMASLRGGLPGAPSERTLLERTLAVTARMVDPDAVLVAAVTALEEATLGTARFLRGTARLPADVAQKAPECLLDAAVDLTHPFWSSEHRPELPEALAQWMDAEGARLVVPVRRSDALYGFLVVAKVDRVPRPAALLAARLGEHLALKFENFALYADAALAARELADYRAFLENLVDSLPVGVAVVAPDMRVRAWNRCVAQQTGIAREDAIGRRYFDDLFPHLRDDPETLATISALERDPTTITARADVEVRGPDGLRYQDLIVAAFRDRVGHPTGVVVITDDVTERVRLGRELEENRRLAALGAFAAAIAHDIRTPLTSIQMNVQILRSRAQLAESDRECLDIAQDEIARLSRSVGEILDYARPLSLAAVGEDLRDLADEVARAVGPLYAERGVSLRVVSEGEGPWSASVDAGRLRQALLNLLDNAVDASSAGQSVVLRVISNPAGPRVIVEDRGRGIPPSHLARVFDPFFTTRPDGTGLGLAIAQKVVRAHGGELSVDSAPGEGSRFTLTLPQDPRAHAVSTSQAAE